MSDLSAAFPLLDNFDDWLEASRRVSAPDADQCVLFLQALSDTGALDGLPGGDDPAPIFELGKLPVGPYTLADGRQFVGMNEFELRAFCREGWRQQQVADIRLAYRLEAMRTHVVQVGPGAGKPVPRTGDLFQE